MIPSLEMLDLVLDELVEKGDFVGHPFRGNQWTDSSGVSQGGAGSTPDEDKRAYELRQQGKSWEDIAKELGYANGGSVRRLAMRHEARLKDGDKDLKVVPPVTPDVPKPSVAEAGGAITSLADPTSVRAARRIMTQLFPDGVHTRLAELYRLKGNGNTLSREELKFLADFERAGELINNAIKAEVLFASSGESKEATILRRQALDEIEKVVGRLGLDHERFGADAQSAASKNLSGLIVNTQGTLMKIYEPSLLMLVTQVEEEFARSGSDETTRAHEYILLTGDVNTPVELSSDDAASDEVNQEMSQAKQSARRTLTNVEVKTKGEGYKNASWLFNKLDRDAGVEEDEPKKTLLQADTVTVVREASSIVQGLLRQIGRGESTLEVVSKMSFDQIIKQGDRDGSTFTFDGTHIPFRENTIQGTTQLIDDNGEPIGPKTVVADKDFGLLGVQARSNLVVKLVREALQDKEVIKSLTYQAENVLREPLSVSSSLLKDPNQNATIPKGGSIHEVRALVKSLSVEVSSTDQQIIETQAAVKVLKGMGVKFTKPSDVPFQTVAAGRSSRVSPDVETDYREAVTDALQYLPQGLTDGSGSQEIIGRFAGGGKLDVTAAAGTGVRRAHATNKGSGKVLVTNPRPKRNRAGSILRGDRSVLLHEIGHGVEYANPWVRYIENLTWRERAGNEKLKGLASLTGNKNYTSDEKAVKDEWRNAYAGKSYGGEKPSAAEAYEIFTTGVQAIFYGDQVIDDKHRNVVLGILAASAST